MCENVTRVHLVPGNIYCCTLSQLVINLCATLLVLIMLDVDLVAHDIGVGGSEGKWAIKVIQGRWGW